MDTCRKNSTLFNINTMMFEEFPFMFICCSIFATKRHLGRTATWSKWPLQFSCFARFLKIKDGTHWDHLWMHWIDRFQKNIRFDLEQLVHFLLLLSILESKVTFLCVNVFFSEFCSITVKVEERQPMRVLLPRVDGVTFNSASWMLICYFVTGFFRKKQITSFWWFRGIYCGHSQIS